MEIGGHKINNWVLIGGGVGVVIVYVLYKRSSGSSAASTASTNTGANSIDPVTGLPYSEDNTVDPLTGMTYLAEAQEYGSVSAAESAMAQNSYAADTSYSAADNGYVGSAGYPTLNVTGADTATGASYATNAAWSQAVTAGLTGLGYNATDIAAALGLFFSQQPLGSGSDGVSYAEIVRAAEAEFGPPPQGTYSIIPEPSSGGATKGTGGTSGAVTKYPAPGGFRVVSKTKTSAAFAWNQTNPPASSFTLAVFQQNGARVYQDTISVPDTTGGGGTAAVSGLTPGFTYHAQVWANGGKEAPPGSTVTFTLPKK